jgi:hypothetical protein
MVLLLLDMNECLLNNGGCEQTCRNVPGSCQCGCHSGYRLSNDMKTCQGRKHIFPSGYSQVAPPLFVRLSYDYQNLAEQIYDINIP